MDTHGLVDKLTKGRKVMTPEETIKTQNELLRLLLRIVCNLGSQSQNFNMDLGALCLEAQELMNKLLKEKKKYAA